MSAIVLNTANIRDGHAYAYGNAWVRQFTLTLNSSGVVTNSDDSTALTALDTVDLGRIPGGVKIYDSLAIVETACSEGIDADVGFYYADGTDVTAFPQDDDYWNTLIALDAQSRTRADEVTAGFPDKFSKDAYLRLTIANGGAAAAASACLFHVILFGEWQGVA